MAQDAKGGRGGVGRISPKGIINLATETRQALGFREGESKLLDVYAEGGGVRIAPAEKAGPNTVKASPRGVIQLPSEAHRALAAGGKGRYSVDGGGAQDQRAGGGISLRSA